MGSHWQYSRGIADRIFLTAVCVQALPAHQFYSAHTGHHGGYIAWIDQHPLCKKQMVVPVSYRKYLDIVPGEHLAWVSCIAGNEPSWTTGSVCGAGDGQY